MIVVVVKGMVVAVVVTVSEDTGEKGLLALPSMEQASSSGNHHTSGLMPLVAHQNLLSLRSHGEEAPSALPGIYARAHSAPPTRLL